MSKTLYPFCANRQARHTAEVVLPTPPLKAVSVTNLVAKILFPLLVNEKILPCCSKVVYFMRVFMAICAADPKRFGSFNIQLQQPESSRSLAILSNAAAFKVDKLKVKIRLFHSSGNFN